MSTHVEAHGHDDPYLAHHFEDIQQQSEAHSLGLWIFLATEIMFFGGLFLAFTVYHVMFSDAFGLASSTTSVFMGTLNTCVLLISSFTMALGVHAAQVGNRKLLMIFLSITFALAAVFLVIKSIEWTEKYHSHHVPGPSFHFELNDPEHPITAAREAQILRDDPYVTTHAQMFFVMYFCLTGLHGIHVIIGMCVIAWMFVRAKRGEFNQKWNTPIELTGLYWHLVDIIWIYLFPIIYLIHRH